MTQTMDDVGRLPVRRAPRRTPYLIRQLVKLVVTLFAITIVIFGLTAIAGDPARDILGQYATDDQAVFICTMKRSRVGGSNFSSILTA